jgi:hypothetical protein
MSASAIPGYDDLFLQPALELFSDPADPELPTREIQIELGFFDCMRRNLYPKRKPYRILKDVLSRLLESDPKLATRVIENEMDAIGLQSLSDLNQNLGIPYDAQRMYPALKLWIERLNRESGIDAGALTYPMSERSAYIASGARISLLYLDLMVAAKTQENRAIVSSLYKDAHIDTYHHQAVTLCRDFPVELFTCIPGRNEGINANRIAESAAHLALAGRLDGEKLAAVWGNALFKNPNAILAAFLTAETRHSVEMQITGGLLFADFEDKYSNALLYAHLASHLQDKKTDKARSAWLQELADSFSSAYITHEQIFSANLDSGGLLLRLMAIHAEISPQPFLSLLDKTKESRSAQMRNDLRKMFFELCFAPDILINPRVIVGRYGQQASSILVENEMIAETVDLRALCRPALKPRDFPDSIRRPYGEFLVSVLCDRKFRDDHRVLIDGDIAQKIVDARVLTRRHWKMISASEDACDIMSKARLSPGILDVCGERLREMALGSALGL